MENRRPAKSRHRRMPGTVQIDPLYQTADPAHVQCASVTFEPGARSAWASGERSSLRVAIVQRYPAGSVKVPVRSPQNWSANSPMGPGSTRAPAATARLNIASQSST